MRKPKLLLIVQKMDEPVNIKNFILDEISDNLTNKYSETNDVNEIVEKAKNEVIEREINIIYENDGKKLIDKGIAEGKLQIIYEMAETNVNNRIIKKKRIVKIINWIKLFVGIFAGVSLALIVVFWGLNTISDTFKSEIYGYDLLSWTNVLSVLGGVAVFFILEPIKGLFKKKEHDELVSLEIERLKKCLKKDF